MRRSSKIMLAAASVLALTAPPLAAHAEWLRAETPHFVIYSDGTERAARDFALKLEMYDRTMRQLNGIDQNADVMTKLPIFLVRNRSGLSQIRPGLDTSILGFYSPSEEGVFAIAIRSADGALSGQHVLMHEYAHHLLLGNVEGAYPAWYVEGFAEYYMTAEIDLEKQEVALGIYSDNRAAWILNETWIPLPDLISKRSSEIRDEAARGTYYPVAWLLTHWFLSDPARKRQLDVYLRDVGQGADSVTAMERATGLSMDQLRGALRTYSRAKLAGTRLSGRFPAVDVAVTRLPPSADALLLLNQRLKVGTDAASRDALRREVFARAARFGDDPLALLASGHAGLHFGDRPAGDRALTRLLEIDPDHVEALQLLAGERLRAAKAAQDPAEARALRVQARNHLAHAYEVDPNDYRTLMGLVELRQGQPGYPNDNDLATMELALEGAPQLPRIRFAYAQALATKDRKPEARAVLLPVANNPHGGGAAQAARAMIAALDAGEAIDTVDIDQDEPAAPPPGPQSASPADSDDSGD